LSYVLTRRRGLGDLTPAQIAGQVGGIASTGATAAVAEIAAHGGTILGLTGASLTAAIPIVGAALAGLTIGIQALIANSGCGITCIETSQWANQAAAKLDQAIHAYFSLAVPRPKSAQTLYLAIFASIWQTLTQQCSQPGTGDAGKRCISDRQAGACTWHQTADKVPPWGTPPAGSCWNWFNGYRDPVANDPNVYDDSAIAASAVSGDVRSALASSVGGIPVWAWAVGAGVLVWAVAST